VLHNSQLSGVPATRTLRLIGEIGDDITFVGCTRDPGEPPTFELDVFDQPPDTEQPRIALVPLQATIGDFAAVAGTDIDAMLSSPPIMAGVTDRYARVEAAIGRSPYPASWDKSQAPTTFHGARSPWSGITSTFIRDLLLGVSQVEVTDPHPPIRPGDVFLTWVLEGLVLMIQGGRFLPNFLPSMPKAYRTSMAAWTDANAVKSVVRVGLLYSYCGLDSFNAHLGTDQDNLPVEDPDQAAMRAAQDAAFDAYRNSIVGRGVSCPTRQEVHATFSVASDSTADKDKVWRATPGNGYTSVLSRLVAAGLYEHQLHFIDNLVSYGVDIDPAADLPAAFRYMCYNAGPGSPAAPGKTWQNVDTDTIHVSLRYYINGLRDMTAQPGVWPTLNDWLAKDRIGVKEESRTLGGARTNAIQYWMLDEEFAIAFPPEVPRF
jgi:hypothetical protein